MASKIVIRIMLVAALIVTAHAIKPFSFGNVTLQALGTARSLSFAMPVAVAERIQHAHYLAQAYGKGLFDSYDNDYSPSIWTKPNLLKSELVAFANLVELDEDAEIRDVKPADASRKPAQKRPVRRIKRDDNHDEDSGCSKTSEIAELPEVRSPKAVALVPPAKLMAYQSGLIAQMMPAMNRNGSRLPSLKVELELISKPAVITSLCRDAGVTKTEVVEAPFESLIGPEEETFYSEPEQYALPAPTMMMPPLPECIRIP